MSTSTPETLSAQLPVGYLSQLAAAALISVQMLLLDPVMQLVKPERLHCRLAVHQLVATFAFAAELALAVTVVRLRSKPAKESSLAVPCQLLLAALRLRLVVPCL
jgi:hypothetical protein